MLEPNAKHNVKQNEMHYQSNKTSKPEKVILEEYWKIADNWKK